LINLFESDLHPYNKENEFEELSVRILASILPHFLEKEDTPSLIDSLSLIRLLLERDIDLTAAII